MNAAASGPRRPTETGKKTSTGSLRTLGDLIAGGVTVIATCEVCLHSARLDLEDLAARHGMFHPAGQMALRPLLQCSVCKSTESVLKEIEPAIEQVVPQRKASA